MPSSSVVSASFEALAESATDAIVIIDEASTILFANVAVERIFGYAPGELIGTPLGMLIPPRLREAHVRGVRRYLATGRPHMPWSGVLLPGLRRDGSEVPLEISFGVFTDEEGRRVFSGFMRDVSDRERQRHELEAARTVAESALGELASVGRIMDLALASATYEGMLQELLHGLRSELHADEATVLVLDDRTNALVVEQVDGLDTGRGTRIPLGEGLAGRVAASGEPLTIEDISRERVVQPGLREAITSLMAVPIRMEGRMIGVVHVGTRVRREFSPADVRLLGIVAERLAGVLARTRLYQAERRARQEAEEARAALAERERELRQLNEALRTRAREERELRNLAQAISGAGGVREIMRHVAEGARVVSGASGVFVEQVLTPGGEVEVVATAGDGVPQLGQRVAFPGSLTEDIIQRRQARFLVRMEGIGQEMAPYLGGSCPGCSALVFPLCVDTEVLGALILLRPPGEGPFSTDVMERLRTLSDLASVSLQRLSALAESEKRRGEAEAAVRSRDEVLSIVSHDLRDPVSTVTTSAALLADPDIRLSAEQRVRQVEVISRSAQRMNRLIQDLLDVTRIEGGRLRIKCACEDARALAAEALDAFKPIATRKSLTLIGEIGEDLPRLYVDRHRVLQVFSNLLNNAVKFTPAAGRITVRAARTSAGGCRFEVSDTGPGLAPDQLAHVFDRFWQARKTAHMGSGLGLAIARGIIEAHRGRIWVESTPGHGTTFSFELSRANECA